jgi:DNA-binding transcriptional LysR family regulator
MVKRTGDDSRSKSHPKKTLVLAALLLPPIGAAAVSPEDAYLAARDRDINNPDLAMRAAVDGLGIAYMIEAYAESFLRSGQLIRVLEDWSPTIEGLFLYYPGHRQVPAALRALIDMLRPSSSRPAKSSLQNPFAEH